ncbi:uncharacterized protein LOC134249704 [Saccostrea cucullata]|uniref:uncharacterized protein LOC134249704 n=1 Tax=Saccostrea cuccullata TaxID=36930 RepID=UPI002ED1876B
MMGVENNLIISGAILLVFLFGQTDGYNYDIGFEYRYRYKAESLVLGDFRVVTIVKFHVRPLERRNGSLICHLHVDSFTQSAGGRTQTNPVGWTFKNGFEISISEDGLITEIAHHHKETADVLNLKKALASVLSAKGKYDHNGKQKFKNWEHDHAGYLEHQYTVHTTPSGYRVNKFHESKDHVYRKHAKTLHYSHAGLIEYVKADDKIILRSKNKNKPPETRYSIPVKKEIEEETTGELKDIESSTSTEVKLISRVDLSKASAIPSLHNHLKVKDSIVVQRQKPEKTSLSKVEKYIETNVSCILSYNDEVHRDRMDCFAHLLQLTQRLQKDGYEELATRELSRKCQSNDKLCINRKNIFIDLLLKEGQNITQNLIIQHFLKDKNVNETVIFRIFFHISDLKHPLLVFLEAVEELCLGQNQTNIGTIAMTKKQKYACLALGTLIKTYRNNKQHSEKIDHLLDSLKKWLSPHNQTNYKEMYRERRQRRSVDKFDRKLHNHTYSKMVLIHTLGNSGSARDHLLTYMKPGEGDNSWRRAAILGMRHFNCVESSTSLLELAVNDEHTIVRKQALEHFEKHPLSKKSVSQHRDIILRRDYRYQTLMRIKRGILKLQAGIDGFLFSLKLPGVQWSKQLGKSSLGATFGLELRNELRLEIKPLSAYALLDIYDDAYAKVTIDWLEIDEYLFRAFVCYRGHAGYDVNVLKDLGVDGIQDLVLVFDKIIKSVVDPVKTVIKNFESIVNRMQGNGIQYIVNKIIELVKKLPIILKTIIKNAIKAILKVIEYGGVPWIDQIKKIITKTRLFIEEIKEDVTQFYNTIADAITVTLPYIGKKLMDTVATIFWVVRNFLSDPVQSVTKFGKCVLDIKLAIGMFLDVKNRIVEQLSFLKGGTPFWVDYWEDFQEIWGDIQDLFRLLFDKKESQTTSEFDNEFSTALTDGISTTKEKSNIFIEIIEKTFGEVTAQFKETLMELVEPFLKAFQSVLNAVKAIKAAYTAVRDIFMKVKNIVQKIFGSKFHITFPNRRRSEDSTCGAGVFPTTTNNRYQTIGVDVQVSYKTKILCPLNGKVTRETKRVTILPTDADFVEYEIVIENIIPNTSIADGGQFLSAGQDIIGEADRSPCDDNSIHVSVRKRSSVETKDSDFEYIDPSPFLDHLVPTPEWIWDCKDFTYINAISVVAADAVDKAEEGIEKVEEELSRLRIEGSDDLGNQFPPEQPNYRPPEFQVATPDDPAAVAQWDKFKEGFKGLVSGFKDIAKQLFDFSGNRTGPNLLDLVDVNSYTLGRIKELLGKKVGEEMKVIFDKLMELRSSITAQNLDGLSISDLRSLLSISFNTVTGSKSNMISRVLSKTENDCPMFQNRLSKGPGNVCFVHRSCNEISCAVLLSHATHKFMATVDIKMDGCLKQITLKSRSKTVIISFEDGADIEQRVSLVDVSTLMSANLVVSISFDWSTPIISISAELCVNDFISCLHIVPVLLNYELDTTCSQEDGSNSKLPSMDSITVQDFIAELSEHHLLDQDILRVIDTIREAMMEQLINDPRTILKILGKEFKNKIDFCEEVDVPFPTGDFLIANATFGPIMAGPIPIYFELGAAASVGLRIHVGLCIKNCNVKGILTPWSGAKVWGGAYVGYFIFKAGIRLTGHLLEARFPLTAEIIYNKFPLDVRGSLDLTLAPLRLKLDAYCMLDFKVCNLAGKCYNVTLTIFRGTMWTFAVQPISANIFTNIKDEKDTSPPEFVSPGLTSRRKRETTDKCIIKQISGRNHNDTAYELQIAADDDKSKLKIFYAIGLQQGGTNVVDFTEMGGFSVLVATNDLPNGVPLYWTVKAVNTQGTDARVYCMLHTYDNTLPDGRVDPSYLFSSHPNVLTATISVFDDSDLKQIHSHALGYSSGKYGSEVVPWKDLTLGSTTLRTGITGNLKHFSVPKNGKLTSIPFSVNSAHTPEDCATQCIKSGQQCVSFDYNFATESCELQNAVESPNAMLRMSGAYANYERLGVGYNSYERYNNISLEHGMMYFFNARITNVLGYVGFLQSYGTMVDFSPPSTGSLGTHYQETFSADGCNASVAQRCVEVTWKKNHRHIIDGKGATTIFNGHTPLKDKMYTRSNHYISVNFDGFHDDESGIYQYTWAAGRAVCYEDVVNFRDPHGFLHSSKHWTHSGYEKNMFLQDGKYFMTVQCLNNVVFGGSLVTTVCHTTPLTVDTTPPFFNSVGEIYFDEHFDLLGIYYKAGDNESFLRSVDFGLGKTKYDVLVRKYSYHEPMSGEDAPYIVIEELDLEEGVPAWPRVRVDNGVGLFKAESGPEPILIDRSPPVAGQVLDGHVIHYDLTYQSTYKEICAQWKGFFDPESGIDHFRWGVGTFPGKDNVVTFHNISHNTRHSCSEVVLQHNTRYYSTVIVFNAALNSKDSNSTSDGVLVDKTPPLPGFAVDGPSLLKDTSFSSETATKSVTWENFTDPESGIEKYYVSVFINDAKIKKFDSTIETSFIDHSVSMKHNDKVYFKVESINKAGLSSDVRTNGYIVDHTPPYLISIQDNENGERYQADDNLLKLRWEFEDTESGIKEYRYAVFEYFHGTKRRFWPKMGMFLTIFPSANSGPVAVDFDEQNLVAGAKYSVHVTAVNKAELSTSHESDGVIIDPTPPVISKVHIGLLEEEEVIENGYIQHPNSQSIRVSWIGDDPESHIDKFYVAIGTSQDDTSVTHGYIDMAKEVSADIKVTLSAFSETGEIYYVAAKAENGAGILSSPQFSKPIMILRENVPGIISDGRKPFIDDDYTNDRFSIAMHFHGFESEACNIVKYEWAIGSKPFFSDINGFTEYGIVHNDTHGKAQTHVRLQENQAYYATVKAKTGHNCHEMYIVSTSDGMTVDLSPPKISNIAPKNDEGVIYDSDSRNIFQSYIDSFEYKWNVTDQTELKFENYSIGSMPMMNDILLLSVSSESKISSKFSPKAGKTYYLNVYTEDSVGFITSSTSVPIVADISPPIIHNFSCTTIISIKQSAVKCSWVVIEMESKMKQISICVGSQEFMDDVVQSATLPTYLNYWTADVKNHSKLSSLSNIYVSLTVTNVIDHSTTNIFKIEIDLTPPVIKHVEFVTWTNPDRNLTRQICQLPWSYVDVNVLDLEDEESGIDRAEICLGSEPATDNIESYQEMEDTYMTVDNIFVPSGTKIYATVRAYNKVGLHSIVTSEPIVVSPDPTIEVFDGKGEKDWDFQIDLNLIQGSYRYSDNCPIREARWSVEDLTGTIIQNYTDVPGNGFVFYNDHLSLKNNYIYYVKVKITDALNRTKVGISDGITVRIQPPVSGIVRDGLDVEDIDYQESITELSANWNDFGDEASGDPTQKMDYYEVSIGDDTRNHITRTNIHYYINVGLNKSYTFSGLDLTPKTVRYYITVRGYSITGAFAESYSNGVRVGFNPGILPGVIESEDVQSSTSEISVSWSEFSSDIGIKEYYIAASTDLVVNNNITFPCSDLQNFSSQFDIVPPKLIGLDTIQTLKNLTLNHGKSYYVTVIASDEVGKCSSTKSRPILVDTTPPNQSNVTIMVNRWNVTGRDKFFVTDSNEIDIKLLNLIDPESGINVVTFRLYAYSDCPASKTSSTYIVEEIQAINDAKVTMTRLGLESKRYYYITITSSNNAGLESYLETPVMLLDTGSPLVGSAIVGDGWGQKALYQSSTSKITAWTAIARTEDAYECDNTKTIFPPDESTVWDSLAGDFSTGNVLKYNDRWVLKIGYDIPLTTVLKSGISRAIGRLQNGVYSTFLSTAKGRNISTSFIVSISSNIPYFPLEFTRLLPTDFSKVNFNTSGKSSSKNISYPTNKTENWIPEIQNSSSSYLVNKTGLTNKSDKKYLPSGFGFEILGDQQEESDVWDCLFWAKDDYEEFHRWVQIQKDPFENQHEYSIQTKQRNSDDKRVWDLEFAVDGDLKANIYGLSFDSTDLNIFVHTWNFDNYEEPIIDPIHPFRSQAVLTKIKIPTNETLDCIYGKGFYDGESGIAEIWVGISDNVERPGNIKELELFKRLCTPCLYSCNFSCDANCSSEDGSLPEFEKIPLTLVDLDLKFTVLSNDGLNTSVETEIVNMTEYYVNVKMVNFAGQPVSTITNPVIIDITPPVCEYIRCLDPVVTGMNTPTDKLGSNKSVGAYWLCEDNISGIKKYFVKVGTETSDKGNKEDENMIPQKDIGTVSKIRLDLDDDIFFENKKTYFVNLIVINGAGLATVYSCSISTMLTPPDVSDVDSNMMNSAMIDEETGTAFMDSLDRFGVKWKNKKNDTKYYKWKMGTSKDGTDIIPSSVIGVTNEGTAEIIGGELWLNGEKTGKSLAAFAPETWGNMTGSEVDNVENNFRFQMEPGRCVFLSLVAFGYSNLETTISSQKLCFERKDRDLILNGESENKTTIALVSSSKFKEVSEGDRNEQVVIDIKGKISGLSIGSLAESDLMADYGSASASDFHSYLTNPSTTNWASTRDIRNRIVKPLGVNFFIAPTQTMEVEFIDVEFKINMTDFDNLTVPALLLWDSFTFNSDTKTYGIWRHVGGNCGGDIKSPIIGENVYKTKICQETFETSSRKRRSTKFQMSNPYQYTLTVMNKSFYNSPPEVDIDAIQILEDTPLIDFQIPYYDNEMDSVQFYLREMSDFGFVNLTSDGKLSYYPKEDFFGNDSVKIALKDDTENSTIVNKTILIEVDEVNDMPMFGYLYNDSSFNVMNNKSLAIILEGNTTSHHLFNFVFADVDKKETLSFISSLNNTADVHITTTRIDDEWILNETFRFENIRTHSEYSADMVTNKTFHGDLFYYILGFDSHNFFTERLETHIFILLSPCVHGFCSPKFTFSPSCQDTSRAASFDSYKCTCYPGYMGVWCENEVDECLQQPCGVFFNCEDKINSYRCSFKQEAIAGLIVVGLVIITLIAILYRFFFCNAKTYRIVHDRGETFDESNDNLLIGFRILPSNATDLQPHHEKIELPLHDVVEAPRGISTRSEDVTAVTQLVGGNDQDYIKHIETGFSRKDTVNDLSKKTQMESKDKGKPLFATIKQKFEKKLVHGIPYSDPIVVHKNPSHSFEVHGIHPSDDESIESYEALEDKMKEVQ